MCSVSVDIKRTEIMDDVLTGKAREAQAKRQAIYRNAAIRPEQGPEAFSMSKIVDEFSKTGAQAKDWKRNLDTEFFANGSSMYVDLKELAGRNKKLLADARREQIRSGTYNTHFDPDEYLLSAFQQQSRLLEKTAERPVKPEGWEELRDSVLKTHELAEDPDVRASLALGAELVKDKDFLSLLKTGKGDQIQSGDSTEYRTMREKLDGVRDAVSALKTGDPEKLNALYRHNMIDSIAEAKASAFDYYRLKLKDGAKTSFWYKSGLKRAQEGRKVFQTLQRENEGSFGGRSGDREAEYRKVSQTIRYERKCAALAVDNMYKLQNREPSDEVRARDVETLYQNREFRRACGDLLDRANGEKIMTMVDDLDKPQIRNRTVEQLSEIAGKAARQAREAEARREQELRILNAPLIQEENIRNENKPSQLQGGAPGKDVPSRAAEFFDPNDGNQPDQPEDKVVYDKEGNVVCEPEKPVPQKGFIQGIIESVNAPRQPERPKEVGFGPGMSKH